VGRGIARRQNNDGYIKAQGPDVAQHAVAIPIWQTQIQDDQVEGCGAGLHTSVGGGGNGQRREAGCFQSVGQKRSDAWFVLDDMDSGHESDACSADDDVRSVVYGSVADWSPGISGMVMIKMGPAPGVDST